MVVYLANAFSINMLSEFPATVQFEEITLEKSKEILSSGEWVSSIGHSATAVVASELLGTKVDVNRVAVKIKKDDVLLVMQVATRLDEGKILTREELESLPIRWYLVRII